MPEPINDRIFRREFGDREVVAALDALTVDEVVRALYGPRDDGTPFAYRTFATGGGSWSEGMPRPGLADDDPAVIQAIARCSTYQLRLKLPAPLPLVDRAHPRECAWCGLPLAELLRACDWGVVTSRYVVTERLTWYQHPDAEPGQRGRSYHRAGLSGVYLEPAWAALFDLPAPEREARIAAAQYPEELAA